MSEQPLSSDYASSEPLLEPARPSQPGRKTNPWPWIVGGCLVLIVLFLAGIGVVVYLFMKAVTTDPVRVEQVAQEILPCDFPAGVEGKFAFSSFVFDCAVLASDEPLWLIFMRAPVQMEKEEMRRQLDSTLRQKGVGGQRQGEQRVEEFRVRGEEVAGIRQIIEQQGEGKQVQWLVFVESQGKQVLVMLMGLEGNVTHQRVQSFLDTVR